MIGIQFSGPGNDEFSVKELKRMRKPTERAILKAQLLLESEVKKILIGKRSGRIYFLGKSKGRRRRADGQFAKKGVAVRAANGRFIRFGSYQASAPGEPPAAVTGRFRQSITHGPVVWEGDHASGVVGTADVRARIFEYGGVTGAGHHVRILPRPYMAPTFLRIEDQLIQILAEAVQS